MRKDTLTAGDFKKLLPTSETHYQLSNGKLLKIYHNLPKEINSAFQCWLARTNVYTEKSFCDYINKKRLEGKSNHVAYTEKEYNKLFKKNMVLIPNKPKRGKK